MSLFFFVDTRPRVPKPMMKRSLKSLCLRLTMRRMMKKAVGRYDAVFRLHVTDLIAYCGDLIELVLSFFAGRRWRVGSSTEDSIINVGCDSVWSSYVNALMFPCYSFRCTCHLREMYLWILLVSFDLQKLLVVDGRFAAAAIMYFWFKVEWLR